MLPYTIDLSQVVSALRLDRNQFDEIGQAAVEAALAFTYEQINLEAMKGLRSSRQTYIRNINKPVVGRLQGSITLTGQLPNMIEQGTAPFDMKLGFSKSSKIKRTKKGGWYLTIPFRWATPGTVGESSAFTGTMPKAIHELAKGLLPTRTAFGMAIQRGQGLSKEQVTVAGFGQLGYRSAVVGGNLTAAQRKGYRHKSPLTQGIIKQVKLYERTKQARYNSFRRVSSKSAQNAWIHTGITARNFMPKALKNPQLGIVVKKIVAQAAKQIR